MTHAMPESRMSKTLPDSLVFLRELVERERGFITILMAKRVLSSLSFL